jgi:nicotinate-nucleotide pyrophosphorylase (carboxylating)
MIEPWSDPLQRQAEALLHAALEEDIGDGDWTSLLTVGESDLASAAIVAREDLVLAGLPLVKMAFLSVDPLLEVDADTHDGAQVATGSSVFRVRGSARSILTAERTALNFLGRLSGIATLTSRFVDQVAGTGAKIVDTRKTTPGWRHLEKWAVRMGGGVNHRMGLYDMVLVKDNHIAAAGGIGAAAKRVLVENARGLPMEIEIEVARPEEVEELRGLEIDRILLDNMDDHNLRESVRRVASWPEPRPTLEASGNMTLERVRSVAETGVDWISVGALTHSARTVDFSLSLTREGGN